MGRDVEIREKTEKGKFMASTDAQSSQPLILLLAQFDHPLKDLVATTLGWMCHEQQVAFDVYYAARRGGGGLFSHHGSLMLGGRHEAMIARALATFRTTVVTLGDIHIFESLVQPGAASVVPVEDIEGVIAFYVQMAATLGVVMPTTAVAFQMEKMPRALQYGTAQFAFPEAVSRRGLAVPFELGDSEREALHRLGVRDVWTIAMATAETEEWSRSGFDVHPADVLAEDDTYQSFTFRVARRWQKRARGTDMCEPVLASSWLPFCIREDRLQVCGENMTEATAALAPIVRGQGEQVVYGRYGGGPLGVARDDEELFNLFENDIVFQVIEPGRPALSVFSSHPVALPQPRADPFSLEPSDDQLRTWADKGKILVSLVTHSGELSHDDAVTNTLDLCAATGVRLGIGMQAQRYLFNPSSIESLHVPTEEGGVLGLCEPVLHSGGFGITAEALASPGQLATMMRQARDEIGKVAGERFMPRGVYCYLDAAPRRWRERPEELWRAIASEGFEYVISSVDQGESQILYQDDDFVVLNLCGYSKYPYSPFMRIDRVTQLLDMELRLAESPGPAWMIGALDIPLYGYSQYMALGDPTNGVRLGDFFAYIMNGSRMKGLAGSGQVSKGGESGRLVSATPHTIARFAKMIAEAKA